MITVDLGDEWRTLEKRLLNVPKKSLRRALDIASKKVRQYSIKHTVDQTDLEGRSFGTYSTNTHHKRPRRKNRKMLVRLARDMQVVSLTDISAEVGWRNQVEGKIAAKHQFGYTEKFNAHDFARPNRGLKVFDDLNFATRQMAKSLIAAGYKVRRKKGGWQTPTIKWITTNMSRGRAGLILRLLRARKELWETVLPPRSFLGTTDNEDNEILALIIKEVHAALDGQEEHLRILSEARYG